NRQRNDERFALPDRPEDAAIARRENHLDADQEQHDPAADADRLLLQLQHAQQELATEQEGDQHRQRNQQFARHYPAPPLRRHVLQQRQEKRNIAERIQDQEQQDPGRQRGHLDFHRAPAGL